jgi:hypothetical protein
MQVLLVASLLLLQAGVLPAKDRIKEKAFLPSPYKPYPENSCVCSLGNYKLIEGSYGAYKVPDYKIHRKTSPLVSSPPTIICFPNRETSRKNFEEQNRRLFFLGY